MPFFSWRGGVTFVVIFGRRYMVAGSLWRLGFFFWLFETEGKVMRFKMWQAKREEGRGERELTEMDGLWIFE